jgi:hypothetical protein
MATGTALSPQLLGSADQRLPAAVVGVRSNDHGVEFRSLLMERRLARKNF